MNTKQKEPLNLIFSPSMSMFKTIQMKQQKWTGMIVMEGRHGEGFYLAETNTYHEIIPNSKTACVRTERQQVGTK